MNRTVNRPYDNELDETIYAVSRKKRIKLKDMADELGITPAGLAKKRRGDSALRLDEAAKLAEILGTSVDEIQRMAPKKN